MVNLLNVLIIQIIIEYIIYYHGITKKIINNKKIFKVIDINECKLIHIIEWNNKYIIVADYNNKSFKIIDLEKNKIISEINGQHTDKVVCIKKIYHPLYGESLLSGARNNIIKLWII